MKKSEFTHVDLINLDAKVKFKVAVKQLTKTKNEFSKYLNMLKK